MYKPKLVATLVPIIIIVASVIFYFLLKSSPGLPSSEPQDMFVEDREITNQEDPGKNTEKKSIFSKFTGNNVVELNQRIENASERALADKLHLVVKSSLECQYQMDKRYPKSLDQLSEDCKIPTGFKIPSLLEDLPDYLPALKYQVSPNGQDYSFFVPAHDTQGIKVTKDTSELIDTK